MNDQTRDLIYNIWKPDRPNESFILQRLFIEITNGNDNISFFECLKNLTIEHIKCLNERNQLLEKMVNNSEPLQSEK